MNAVIRGSVTLGSTVTVFLLGSATVALFLLSIVIVSLGKRNGCQSRSGFGITHSVVHKGPAEWCSHSVQVIDVPAVRSNADQANRRGPLGDRQGVTTLDAVI